MRVQPLRTDAIGALCGLLLAAPLAGAAQHQHASPPDSHSAMQPVTPEKADKAIKVGKNGDVNFGVETLVGDLRLKPGRYQVQHRTDGPDHFVHFKEVAKAGRTVADAGEVRCRLETLDHKMSVTEVHTREEGGSARVTKVLIRGENVAHLF